MKDKRIISSREDVARFVLNNHKSFKVCEGCDSILKRSACLCPVCATYRFNATKQAIFDVATRIANGEERKTILESDLY